MKNLFLLFGLIAFLFQPLTTIAVKGTAQSNIKAVVTVKPTKKAKSLESFSRHFAENRIFNRGYCETPIFDVSQRVGSPGKQDMVLFLMLRAKGHSICPKPVRTLQEKDFY